MATQQAVEAAKQEARNIAKDFAEGEPGGYATIYTWVYNEACEGLQGDFTDAQRNEILDAGVELLPVAA